MKNRTTRACADFRHRDYEENHGLQRPPLVRSTYQGLCGSLRRAVKGDIPANCCKVLLREDGLAGPSVEGMSIDVGKLSFDRLDSRSQMNVCFLLNDESLNDKFNTYTEQHDVLGLKGHRSVGGFRASIYNAMPESGVDTLIEVMKEFERMA